MQRKPAKRSSLFLLELIIAILFFCLASAVCVRFFVRSHVMEQETTELNLAVDQAVSAAEILRSGQDIAACLKDYYPDIVSFEDENYHTTYSMTRNGIPAAKTNPYIVFLWLTKRKMGSLQGISRYLRTA